MLTIEEINKHIPLPGKMVPTAGIREMKLVGSVVVVCGIAIICLAVPTTCLLPYSEYGLLHAHNYLIPLILIAVGATIFTTASDVERANWINPETRDSLHLIRSGYTMKRAICYMIFAIACIMEGSGEFINDASQGVFHQVMKQIRSGKWGDLNPTETQLHALEGMYGIINVAYVTARMALVFGIILSTVIWVNRANASDAQKDEEAAVTMSKGSGTDGEHVKIVNGGHMKIGNGEHVKMLSA